MNLEGNRLNSFADWPSSAPVDPIRIAKAGFFFTGQGTEVQCFSCGGKISEWNYGDQVMWRHRQMEPNCAFIVSPQLSGNVPIVLVPDDQGSSETLATITNNQQLPNQYDSSRQNHGTNEHDDMFRNDSMRLLSFVNWQDNSVSRESLASTGFYHVGDGRLRCAFCGGELAPFRSFGTLGPPLEVHRMYFPHCYYANAVEQAQNYALESATQSVDSPERNDNEPQSSGASQNSRILSDDNSWRALGVVGGSAKHANFANLTARLATYTRWPRERTQRPEDLAEAGFFYTGTGDQVRCFYCDGGLGKWEAGDAPWSEHGFWFPNCGFLLLAKGQEFLDGCRNRPTEQRTQLSEETGTIRRTTGSNFPVDEREVEEILESGPGLTALSAGLDAARIKKAIIKRLRSTGQPFTSSEALIDAVLDQQLNEEPWNVRTRNQRMANRLLRRCMNGREILDTDSSTSPTHSRTPSPQRVQAPTNAENTRNTNQEEAPRNNGSKSSKPTQKLDNRKEDSEKKVSLEEENRQLKEARLCKVCMDNEVSVVFLPCGHLVSCAGCSAALKNCPLCRADVKALVRAYLA